MTSDLILLRYKVVEILRKQNALPPILTLDKALHQEPQLNPSRFYLKRRFHTACTNPGYHPTLWGYPPDKDARQNKGLERDP